MISYSPVEPMYFILPLIGLLVGLFATIVGGGGGFFFLPVLILIFKSPTHTAVITSLIATLPIGIVGVLGHHKKGNVDFRLGSLFAVFGVVGAIVGTFVSSKIGDYQLKVGFGLYAIFLSSSIIYGAIRNNNSEEESSLSYKNKYIKKMKASFFGFFGGAISGSFGTSGTGPVIAGMLSLRLPMKLAVGTSLMVVTVNAMSAIGAHFFVGHIDLTLVGFLTIGSIIGSIVGPKLVSRIYTKKSDNKARYIYALVLITIGVLMIVK